MKPQEKEFLVTHLFDAPIGVVYDEWTDPEKLKN